jgi:D-glycero-D-manno-heptose 1,7-bisphosphate phosphatase
MGEPVDREEEARLPASRGGARPAVFVDRDGTLNEDRGYVGFPEQFAWIAGAVDALRRLNDAGLFVVVVTNQAGVARGYYTEDDVRALHEYMRGQLGPAGARIDAFYYSPYHTAGVVDGYSISHPDRKPGVGMYERAIREHDLDPTRSFAIGDKESDITPGNALGMRTILVRTGYGREHEPKTRADVVVDDFAAAVDEVLGSRRV